MSNAPGPITRGALERVLSRASELQAASGDASEPEALTEQQLVELGAEVGLSPENLRQALAEERARGDHGASSDTLADSLFGRAEISAQRVVRGSPAVVMNSLDVWMQREEWMRVVRDRADRRVWEPRRDLIGGLRRALGGRAHQLHVASEVAGSVAAVDGTRSVVALSADIRRMRGALIGQTAVSIGVGAIATGVLSVLGFMSVVAVIPVVALSGSYFIARNAQRQQVARAQAALEQVLDRMERHGDAPSPPSLLKALESALPRGL